MYPILFHIGKFPIPSYGLILVIAFLLSVYLLRREAARMGLDERKTADTAIIGLLFGLVGAKLLLILVDLPDYLSNPREIFETIRSAGVIYGGLIGGSAGMAWYLRKHKLPLWSSLDVMAPFAALGMGLGRLSCLAAGCCWGKPYDGPLALHFPDHPYCHAPAEVGLFPVQLVGLLNGVLLFGLLLFLLRRRTFHGQVISAFIFLYALTRGLIELARGDDIRGLWFNNTSSTSQIIALFALVFAVWLYWKRRKESSS